MAHLHFPLRKENTDIYMQMQSPSWFMPLCSIVSDIHNGWPFFFIFSQFFWQSIYWTWLACCSFFTARVDMDTLSHSPECLHTNRTGEVGCGVSIKYSINLIYILNVPPIRPSRRLHCELCITKQWDCLFAIFQSNVSLVVLCLVRGHSLWGQLIWWNVLMCCCVLQHSIWCE